MAVTVKQLTTPLVKSEVLTDLYTLLGLMGLTTTALQPGEPVPVILDVIVGWIVDKVWNPFIIPALRAIFLDYAFGDWLTLVAWLIYNRPRLDAQPGTSPLVIENRSTVSGTVNVNAGAFRVRHKITGKTYTNTVAFSVLQWSGSGAYPDSGNVNFEADEAGTGSNAEPGDIEAYPNSPVTTPSVGLYARTNTSAFVGSDEEGDPNLITRCRAAVGDLAASGPILAYVCAALDPIGAFTRRKGLDGVSLKAPASWGTAAPAISRVRVVDGSNAPPWLLSTQYLAGWVVANGGRLYQVIIGGISAGTGSGPSGTGTFIIDGSVAWKYLGTVAVFCASPSGAAGGNDTTADSDVFKANTAIQLFVVPPGTTAKVAPAVEREIQLGVITLYVRAESNVTAEEAVANATTAIENFGSTLPISGARRVSGGFGHVYANKVYGVFESPDYIDDVDIDPPGPDPFGDTVLGAGDVAVFTYTTIQANIVSQ